MISATFHQVAQLDDMALIVSNKPMIEKAPQQ